MTAPLVHILGCGRTARTIARLMVDCRAIRVGQVLNRSKDSAMEAVEFIGDGEPVEAFDGSLADGWLLIGLPDGRIGETVADLIGTCSEPAQLAFHLSGSVPSEILQPLGTSIASVHPLKAFSDPQQSIASFSGTWCAAEGEQSALDRLQPIFEAIGARWVTFRPKDKAAWHAATVAASNFLVTVNAQARELARLAGMETADATRLMYDLQRGTLDNLAEQSAAKALTGPFERGDLPACRRLHGAAHGGLPPASAALFDHLALATLALAREKRGERPDDDELERLFTPD